MRSVEITSRAEGVKMFNFSNTERKNMEMLMEIIQRAKRIIAVKKNDKHAIKIISNTMTIITLDNNKVIQYIAIYEEPDLERCKELDSYQSVISWLYA